MKIMKTIFKIRKDQWKRMKNILNYENLINIHMDFKTKTRVPCEKSGRHSNAIYLVLKPLNKSGTAFWLCLFNPETPKTPKFWIFVRPAFSMYCNYAEYACKLQKIYPTFKKIMKHIFKTLKNQWTIMKNIVK